MAEADQDYAAVIRAQGAEFLGMQFGPHGAVILFNDPESRSTLAVPEFEFSPQVVSRCLEASRRAYDLEALVQKSLC